MAYAFYSNIQTDWSQKAPRGRQFLLALGSQGNQNYRGKKTDNNKYW